MATLRLLRVAGPAWEPVTIDEVKEHVVLQHNQDDAYLQNTIIPAARARLEADTGRSMVQQTWQLVGSGFLPVIHLRMPPLIQVASIQYSDADGVEQTLDKSAYQVASSHTGATIQPAPGCSWPAVQRGRVDAVTVTYSAGYVSGTESSPQGVIPHNAKLALLILAGDMLDNRDLNIVGATVSELPTYSRLISSLEVDLI